MRNVFLIGNRDPALFRIRLILQHFIGTYGSYHFTLFRLSSCFYLNHYLHCVGVVCLFVFQYIFRLSCVHFSTINDYKSCLNENT